MSFFGAVTSVFSQYATFSGRARRREYWYFVLFNFIVYFVLGLLTFVVPVLSWISSLYSIAVIVPSLAVDWRRLHDIGKSGAFVFLALIPLVGAIILLVWFCQDSQPGPNQYGPNPKEEIR